MLLRGLRRLIPAALLLAASLPAAISAAAAPSCTFELGFAALQQLIPQQVGACQENETHNPTNGDGLQHSSGGLLVWRKADNWTAFTDGFHTWINGPRGLQQRLNTQRFSWEGDFGAPGTTPVGGGGPSEPVLTLPVSTGPLSTAPAPFDSSPDGRFGGIQVSDVGVGVAQDLGLQWTREQFLWNNMPSFNPGLFASISTDQHLGSGLREVGLLNFFAPYCNGGQDKRVPCSNDAVTQYTTALARAEQGKVNSWIMYNEPDICNPSNPGYAWNSPNRAVDYLHYAQAAYTGIKAGNPGADVILGSLGITDSSCQTNGDEMTFWHQMLAALGNAPLPADEVSLNIHKEPEKIYDLIKSYHESMQQHGYDKSLWLMEVGIPLIPSLGPGNTTDSGLEVDKNNQESFLIQAYANAIAAGADHIGIYTMRDFPPSDPAYNTIKAAVKFMSHVTSAVKSPDNRSAGGKYVDRLEGVVTITMKGPGFETVVAYNRSLTPQTVTIPATATTAVVSDKHGNETTMSAQNGGYTVTLDPVGVVYNAPWGETVRFIGGSPVMLRQAD